MTLGPYNTVTLAATTPVQLLPPSSAHWYYQFNNTGPGHLYISNSNGVGANATSAVLAAGQTATIPAYIHGLWVASDQAGTVSVLPLPRGA